MNKCAGQNERGRRATQGIAATGDAGKDNRPLLCCGLCMVRPLSMHGEGLSKAACSSSAEIEGP
jgi:hypothetical protein